MSAHERSQALGMLDWGIGGLGVLRAMRERGITTRVIYLSDTGATPYGRMSVSALSARVDHMTERLQSLGATRVLIACNAASTVIDRLAHRMPISGVIEPALRCIPSRQRGVIGVIGGARTIRSGLYRRGLEGDGRQIIQRVAQPLSAHIEAGTIDRASADLRRILTPLRHADAVLLACTHYAAIADKIAERVGTAQLFDPAARVAAELSQHLAKGDGSCDALTTGDAAAMRDAAERTWGLTLERVRAVNW